MDNIVVVKVVMPEESLPQGIEGEVISVYTEEPYEMKISCTVLKRRFIESNDDRNGCRLNPKEIMQKLYRIIMKLCD
ncbi:hypothetical protein G4B88_021793 [Cannabis sativa]|uniref:Uncharacterized protein n=1 Tax=Cannabis sativa TaxID=3483 RepID=A0A7J6F2X6_CANSA|nr:hypothetical protein G4B88_021793 [Cannabis sativa]